VAAVLRLKASLPLRRFSADCTEPPKRRSYRPQSEAGFPARGLVLARGPVVKPPGGLRLSAFTGGAVNLPRRVARVDIGLHGGVEVLGRNVKDGRTRLLTSGVHHQDVKAAEAPKRFIDEALAECLIAEIARNR
jgi:hypothetical protein